MLYEIWSLGHKPFETLATDEVCVYMCLYGCVLLLLFKVIEKIESGYRLPPPPGCPRTIYRTMIKCWYVIKMHAVKHNSSKQIIKCVI